MTHRYKPLAELVFSLGEEQDLPPSNCVDLFLFLQAHFDYLSPENLDDFKKYCERHIPLLHLGVGYREILDGFINMRGILRKVSGKIERVQKKIIMSQAERQIFLPLKYPPDQISWARLRLILCTAQGAFSEKITGTPLTAELWGSPHQLIYKKNIVLLNFPKEELTPTSDLTAKLKLTELPLWMRLTLPQALPELTIQIILEIAR